MAGTSTLLGLRYPTGTDAISPVSIQALAYDAEQYMVGVWTTTAARDTAWANAGGQSTGGKLAYITGTGELTMFNGSVWVTIGGRAAPFATAAGAFGWGMTAVNNITVTPINFPSGRFSLAPIVVATQNSAGAGTLRIIVRAFNITTASFSANMSTGDGTVASPSGESVGWVAFQMTSTSATG